VADRVVLPVWPEGTVCVLATAAGGPFAIPVSTAVRAGDARVAFALAAGRGSLARLRAEPRVALAVLAGGDVAFTAHGTAAVVADPLPGVEGVCGVVLEVDELREHRRPTFRVRGGVDWEWTDPGARERDAVVRAALRGL
jgi:hypothetical protein